jgi:hypothetical protein
MNESASKYENEVRGGGSSFWIGAPEMIHL